MYCRKKEDETLTLAGNTNDGGEVSAAANVPVPPRSQLHLLVLHLHPIQIQQIAL